MLRANDIIFGVRNLLLVSLCFLFVNAVFASLFGLANISYPANLITNLVLWLAVLIGSYATTSNLPWIAKSWFFGIIIGGVYGLVVFVVMTAIYGFSGALSGESLAGLLPIIILYAVLGLVGSFLGGMLGTPRTGYSLNR